MTLNEYARKMALTLLLEGLRAVDPYSLVMEKVEVEGGLLKVYGHELDVGRGVYVVALGKAAGAMVRAVEELLGDLVMEGVAAVPRKVAEKLSLKRVRVVAAGHPYPDEGSLEAGRSALKLAEKASREGAPLLVLISGGGSALMEFPAKGLGLEDLRRLTNSLLKAGATIDEVNAVRKHLSAVKGGRLAAAASPSPVLSLIISDVVGDRLDVIASGPTTPDPTTYADAVEVLKRYGLYEESPESVKRVLEEGVRGERPETPKPGDPRLENVVNVILGNNMTGLLAMEKHARKLGLNSLILSSMIEGEAREAAKVIAAIALEVRRSGIPVKPPAAIIAGGETVVTVRGGGRGGRNQEFALSAALQIEGVEGIAIAAMGSDGIDGPTDAAGAVVDGETSRKAREMGLDPLRFLDDNNSYEFFKAVGGHIVTGPTGTNVNDFYIAVVVTEEVAW